MMCVRNYGLSIHRPENAGQIMIPIIKTKTDRWWFCFLDVLHQQQRNPGLSIYSSPSGKTEREFCEADKPEAIALIMSTFIVAVQNVCFTS